MSYMELRIHLTDNQFGRKIDILTERTIDLFMYRMIDTWVGRLNKTLLKSLCFCAKYSVCHMYSHLIALLREILQTKQ